MISGLGFILSPSPSSNAGCAHAWMKNRRRDGGIVFRKGGLVRANTGQSSVRGERMGPVGNFGGLEESLLVRSRPTRYRGELAGQTPRVLLRVFQ